MALATRCPHCNTTFRLDPHLLAPHDGRVRCGHCQEVFDAAHYQFGWVETAQSRGPALDYGVEPFTPWAPTSAAIVDDGNKEALGVSMHPFVPDSALAPQAQEDAPSATSTQPETASGDVSRTKAFAGFIASAALARQQASSGAGTEVPAQPAAPVPPDAETDLRNWSRTQSTTSSAGSRSEPFVGRAGRADPEAAIFTDPAPGDAPWPADPEPHFSLTPRAAAPLPPAPNDTAEPFPVLRETRARDRSGVVWKTVGAVVALVLLITLIAQLAWWQREAVMVYWPDSQSLFVKACEQMGCVVGLPRDIDGLQIENSGLRQVDGAHKLELKLSLHNRLDVALAYPALELTLLDDKNNVAIRRVLWPQDYARPGTTISAGIAPRSTQPVNVRLDTGDAVAANYRVQIFYP
jgi:predicted Zn finger-like uncharacterized protein